MSKSKYFEQHRWYIWQASKCIVMNFKTTVSLGKSPLFWGCIVFCKSFCIYVSSRSTLKALDGWLQEMFPGYFDPWVRLSASRILSLLLHSLMNWPEKIQRTIQNGSPRLNWSIISKAQSIHHLILYILWTACLYVPLLLPNKLQLMWKLLPTRVFQWTDIFRTSIKGLQQQHHTIHSGV